MDNREISHIIAAILILTAVVGFAPALQNNWPEVSQAFLISAIIILVSVFAKKTCAYLLDSDVEHELWKFSRYGLKPGQRFRTQVPGGIIFPLFFSLISLGILKITTILTYETRALKIRAAKRFGHYSYTEMTDWHTGLIGASGILAMFIVAIISYFSNWETLARIASYYAFWNMLPIAKFDGTQIFFGSRVLWSILAIISLVFTGYALLLI